MARSVSALALMALLLLAVPPLAWADSHAAGEPGRAAATGEAGRGWHYETGYLFGLTRGLPEAGVRHGWRYPAMVFTLPFDAVNLPIAALAGLFG